MRRGRHVRTTGIEPAFVLAQIHARAQIIDGDKARVGRGRSAAEDETAHRREKKKISQALTNGLELARNEHDLYSLEIVRLLGITLAPITVTPSPQDTPTP